MEWDAPRKSGWKPAVCALIAIFLAVAAVAGMALNARGWEDPSSAERTRHIIDVTVAGDGASARVAQGVSYLNASGGALEELWFMLYPNAFRAAETAPFTRDMWSLAYPEGFSPGGIEGLSMSVAGSEIDAQPEGPGGVYLRVPLDAPLEHGERAEIEFAYELVLPRSDGRFGYSGNEIRICNAFITPAVRKDGAWLLYPHGAMGDPFVTEAADYTVSVVADARFRLLATGYDADAAPTNEPRRIEARGVRDMAIVLSRMEGMAWASLGRTRIYSLAEGQNRAEAALDAAKESLRVYEELYGAYPYDTFTVVASDFFIGGMEYPGLVLIDKTLYANQQGMLEYIIAHEAAHQWWYAVVGNDQCTDPWLDESLASHATMSYYKQRYGSRAYEAVLDAYAMPGASYVYWMREEFPPVGAPLSAFYNEDEYSAVVYDYGTLVFEQARAVFGDDALNAALARYYRDNRFSVASPEDFFAAASAAGSPELSEFLRRAIIFRQDPWREELPKVRL